MIAVRPMKKADSALFQKWLYTPHVAKWYHHPQDWLFEVGQQDGEFHWLFHAIVECDGKPIGFCQYYACIDSKDDWEGYTALGGSYSIDYIIGESDYLGKGLGKEIVIWLINTIRTQKKAKRVVVQPEQKNEASCGILHSCGFLYDNEKDIYVLTLVGEAITPDKNTLSIL